jgi:hypothetical protein
MGTLNAILRRQILVLEQQFLIDQASDVRQQPYPLVFFHLDGHDTPSPRPASNFLALRDPIAFCLNTASCRISPASRRGQLRHTRLY